MFDGHLDNQDLIEDMRELHIYGSKKNLYLLYSDGQIRASTAKIDIIKHLEDDDAIVKYDEESDDTILLFGLLMDPTSLPYEIPPNLLTGRKLYLLVESGTEMEYEQYDEIEEVTDAIAELMQTNQDLEIEDFAVLLAQEIPIVLTPGKTGEPVPIYQALGE